MTSQLPSSTTDSSRIVVCLLSPESGVQPVLSLLKSKNFQARGAGPYGPSRGRPPVFLTQHKKCPSLKVWCVLPVQTLAGSQLMAGREGGSFHKLVCCYYSLLHMWDLFFTALKVKLTINSSDQSHKKDKSTCMGRWGTGRCYSQF